MLALQIMESIKFIDTFVLVLRGLCRVVKSMIYNYFYCGLKMVFLDFTVPDESNQLNLKHMRTKVPLPSL